MKTETISDEPMLVIRRMTLAPGESSAWHCDRCRRFSVVVAGSQLRVEYRDSGRFFDIPVHAGMAGWDDPEPEVHRAVNTGNAVYEEVVAFHRDIKDLEPQPTF
ncbi:MAG: hypothetical protein ACR2PZ_19655 [Pseudomonadales bacterium]